MSLPVLAEYILHSWLYLHALASSQQQIAYGHVVTSHALRAKRLNTSLYCEHAYFLGVLDNVIFLFV